MNLYLHIPFCSGKCVYCSFYSERYRPERADAYLDALEREMQGSEHLPAAVETLYIGGGTPSTLSLAQWQRLTEILHQQADLSACREWTIEANPGTVSPALAAHWCERGVTRLSLGVQSMHDATLERMGRRHNAAQTAATVARLRASSFGRIGLDLIAGLPGVSPAEWETTLQRTLALAPDHVSVYACSIEPGSRLHALRQRGQHQPPDDTAMDTALEAADELLGNAGFEHYETSNHAQPGQRCRHNVNIWQGADYLGFGPAAASRVGLQRWTNTPDLDAYCAVTVPPPRERDTLADVPGASSSGSECPPPRACETLTPATDAAERLIFRFRLADPVSLDEVVTPLGPAAQHLRPYWQQQIDALVREGLLTRVGNAWRTTPRGARLADTIAEALLPPHPFTPGNCA